MMLSFNQVLLLWSTAADIEKHTLQHGEAELAAAIAMKESGGDILACHHNNNGSIDRGIWQINSIHDKEFSIVFNVPFREACYNPVLNARMALTIYRKSGWKAWSTFNALA